MTTTRPRGPRLRGPRCAALAAGLLAAALAGCTAGGSSPSSSGSSPAAVPSRGAASTAPAAPATAPFGAGCAAVPTDGPGSLAAMTTAPVGTAVAGNPVLSQLARAVVAANLIDTLNGLQDVTLIAPDDAAFAALPGGPGPLLGNTPQLTAVLTHHVIAGRLTPDRLVGTHTTLDDDQVTISRAGDVFTISGDQTETGALATVVCGDVQTANATVYVVDQVLKPGKTG